MFSKTKKFAGVMLAAAMIVTAFAGCGGGDTTGGEAGGEIIATGTPNEVAQNTESHTAKYLKKIF